jgi:putative membrane protein
MKWLLRAIFLNGLILYLAVLIYPGMSIDTGVITLLVAAASLTVLNKIVKPLIKLLLLPINLVTMGLFGWVVNVLSLFLLTYFVNGFSIYAFYFNGWSYQGFVIPAMQISILYSFILGSIVLSLVSNLVYWLVKG